MFVCKDGGLWPRGIVAFCGMMCTLDADMEHFFIRKRRIMDDEHMKIYGPQIEKHPEVIAPLSALDVLSSGSFELGCRNQCIAMGDNTQSLIFS